MPTAVLAETTERIVAEVVGHVQGVGYRYFARSHARRLNLTGWVRNDPNGVVTVTAEGPRPDLEQFIALLEKGPDLAEVDEVNVEWGAPTHRFKQFAVLLQ